MPQEHLASAACQWHLEVFGPGNMRTVRFYVSSAGTFVLGSLVHAFTSTPRPQPRGAKRGAFSSMATILDDSGPDISKRAVQPMLNDDTTGLVAEAQEILKAGLSGTSWIAAADTGTRMAATRASCPRS